jgi:hypothetical protein
MTQDEVLALVYKMRRQSQAVYLACEEAVAADISDSLQKAANYLVIFMEENPVEKTRAALLKRAAKA